MATPFLEAARYHACASRRLAFAATHRDSGAGRGTGTVLRYGVIGSICSGRRKCLKAVIRGVPSKMYSRTTPSSPPPADLLSSGAYVLALRAGGRWQTPQA